MSRFPGRDLLLGCTNESAVLLARGTSTPLEVLASADLDPSTHASIEALCGLVAELKSTKTVSIASRSALSVIMDDSAARSFIVTPPGGAQGLAELRATVAARFAALYGESPEEWLLAADWHAAAPFIACALPRRLYREFEDAARANGWRLVCVRPALVQVWNRVCRSIPADGWLIVGFGKTLTLVHTLGAQLASLRTVRLPEAPGVAELVELIEQERLRSPMPGAQRDRQSLLWSGSADWLPETPTMAGLASRTLPLPPLAMTFVHLSEPCQLACQLALAGSPR